MSPTETAIPLTSIAPSQVLPRDDRDRARVLLPGGEVTELKVGGPYRLEADGVVVDDVLVGDLWGLAGQSNMAGAGELEPAPEPVEQARMLSYDGRWKPAVEPLHRLWLDGDTVVLRAARRFFHPGVSDKEWQALLDRAEELEAPKVGPGAAFARALTASTGVPVGLLPCALGATSLALWMPDVEPDLEREATLYGNLVARARRYGPLRGVLWHQGEGDTGPGLGETYAARFTSWVEALRRDLGDPDLPVIAAQICRYDLPQLKRVLDLDVDPSTTPGWPAVRDAMRRVGDSVERVEVVATADLGLVDGIHLDRAGQEALGRRFAAVAAQYVPGADAPPRRSPRLSSVVASDGGTTVTCRFDDVVEGLKLCGPCDFEIASSADGGAAETVTTARVVAADTVVVEVPRALSAAGATLTYGPGLNPRAGLVDGRLAVPLFGPVPIG